ncbi:DUF6881 domain-containing protein [Kitasatospora terrestris]|uniref:DUF6881 domain-containing protein n=1 Tax=Kitasatospora terrestris TaxID=258051 RepID=A0ABP9DZ97_9ACTN
MQYLKVLWRHDSNDEPIVILSEIGEDGYERRKVEMFRDGSVGFADSSQSLGGTLLGEVPVPSLAEINSMGEFYARRIERKTFESAWRRVAAPRAPLKKARGGTRQGRSGNSLGGYRIQNSQPVKYQVEEVSGGSWVLTRLTSRAGYGMRRSTGDPYSAMRMLRTNKRITVSEIDLLLGNHGPLPIHRAGRGRAHSGGIDSRSNA